MQLFISHSSADKPFVRKLMAELELRKLKVWLDEVDIRVGQSITKEISNALSTSDIFCFIISKDALKSGWVDREFSSIMPIIISGTAYLIPCKIDDSKAPTIIRDIKYADFRKDFDIGLNELLNGVKIKEHLNYQLEIEKLKEKLITELNNGELAFFEYYFSNRDYFFIGDNRKTKAPYDLLGKLTKIGILDFDADRHEYLYSLSEKGKDVIKIVQPLIDRDIHNRLKPLIDKDFLR